MLALVTQLASHPAANRALQTAVTAGYGRFYKFAWGFQTDDGYAFIRRTRAMMWVGGTDGINVNQRFIDVSFRADPISGFDVKTLTLLHELYHVVDRVQKYSESREFRAAYMQTLDGVDRWRCTAIRDRYVGEANLGREDDAWYRMRMAIQALPTGYVNRFLPSGTVCLTTADGFEEGFADYAAYWALDRRANTYLPQPIADWLRTTFPISDKQLTTQN